MLSLRENQRKGGNIHLHVVYPEEMLHYICLLRMNF